MQEFLQRHDDCDISSLKPFALRQLLADHLDGQLEQPLIADMLEAIDDSMEEPQWNPAVFTAQNSSTCLDDALGSRYTKAAAFKILQPVCDSAYLKLLDHVSPLPGSIIVKNGENTEVKSASFPTPSTHTLRTAHVFQDQADSYPVPAPVTQSLDDISQHLPVHHPMASNSGGCLDRSISILATKSTLHSISTIDQANSSPKGQCSPGEHGPPPSLSRMLQQSTPLSGAGSPVATLTDARCKLADLVTTTRAKVQEAIEQLEATGSAARKIRPHPSADVLKSHPLVISPAASQCLLMHTEEQIRSDQSAQAEADISISSADDVSHVSGQQAASNCKESKRPSMSHLGLMSQTSAAHECQAGLVSKLLVPERNAQHLPVTSAFCSDSSHTGQCVEQPANGSAFRNQWQQQRQLGCRQKFSPKENVLEEADAPISKPQHFTFSAGPASGVRKKRRLQAHRRFRPRRTQSCPQPECIDNTSPDAEVPNEQVLPLGLASSSPLKQPPASAALMVNGVEGHTSSMHAGIIAGFISRGTVHLSPDCWPQKLSTSPTLPQAQLQHPTTAFPQVCQQQTQATAEPHQEGHGGSISQQAVATPTSPNIGHSIARMHVASPELPSTKASEHHSARGPPGKHQQDPQARQDFSVRDSPGPPQEQACNQHLAPEPRSLERQTNMCQVLGADGQWLNAIQCSHEPGARAEGLSETSAMPATQAVNCNIPNVADASLQEQSPSREIPEVVSLLAEHAGMQPDEVIQITLEHDTLEQSVESKGEESVRLPQAVRERPSHLLVQPIAAQMQAANPPHAHEPRLPRATISEAAGHIQPSQQSAYAPNASLQDLADRESIKIATQR